MPYEIKLKLEIDQVVAKQSIPKIFWFLLQCTLLENYLFLRTDNVHGEISEHKLFATKMEAI